MLRFRLALLALMLVLPACAGPRNAAQPGQGGAPSRSFAPLPLDGYVDPAIIAARRANIATTLVRSGHETLQHSANAGTDSGAQTCFLDAGTDFSWAIYQFSDLLAADNLSQITLDLDDQAADGLPQTLYVAFSDYAKGYWSWQVIGVPGDLSLVPLPGGGSFISPGGSAYVAVAVAGGDTARVQQVRLDLNLDNPAPGNVQATDLTVTAGIDVSWDASGAPVDGYRVERASNANGPWTAIGGTLPSAQLSYSDVHDQFTNDLPVGQPFHYRVRSVSGGNSGPPSASDVGSRGSAPVAKLSFSFIGDNPPFTVQLDAAGSGDPDGGPVDYEWDWTSDGTYDTVPDPLAVVQDPTQYSDGTYQTTVRVTDDEGMMSTATVTVTNFMHTWGTAATEDATDAAVDASGNVYACGSSGPDALLLKYDPDGNVLWTKVWNPGDLLETASLGDIEVDGAGNIYASGTYTPSAAVASDLLLLKLDGAGNIIWQKAWGGLAAENGYRLLLDGALVYASGSTESYGAGMADGVLLQLIADGTLSWQRTWGGTDLDSLAGMTVHPLSGRLLVCGSTRSFGAGATDVALLYYDINGNLTNSALWGGPSEDSILDITADGAGNIYGCGSTLGFGAASEDIMLVQMDSTGAVQWARLWGGASFDSALRLQLTPGGSLYVAGYSSSFGGGGGDYDGLLLEYDTGGGLLGSRRWFGAAYDDFQSANLTPDGQLLLTGSAPRIHDGVGLRYWSWGLDPPGAESQPIVTQGTPPIGADGIPAGTLSDALGSLTDGAGTADTGGGGDDALVIHYRP